MSVANPNWLTIAGLLYAAIGVLLLATALASSTRRAGAFGTFGAVVAAAGFLIQSVAQFHVLPAGGTVVLLMLGLIALLGGYGVAAMGAGPSQRTDEPVMAVVAGARPTVADIAAEAAATAAQTSAVKLVSAAG